MNVFNITAEYSRGDSLDTSFLRAAIRRENQTSRGRWRRARGRLQRIRLEFQHPLARRVEIAGSFNDWRLGVTWMIPLGGGRWVKELMLPPGPYAYCFVVDGDWMAAQNGAVASPDGRGHACSRAPCSTNQ